ncbi:MAG TPA: ABC transporter ATP-binding protein [Gemmatimonadaceae bacterium]|nr:ABC transporter ATP-binding protein [Gemmatimonadaceae bacterium]
MIAFERAVVRYTGSPAAAVNGVSFTALRGAVTAVVGPNGSGKSTLVRALLGRVPVSEGRIVIDGADLNAIARRDVARRCAVVVQREEPVFPLPVADYVTLGRYPHRTAWTFADRTGAAAVRDALHVAGADSLAERRTDELSGGEWQRVRLARALAQGADALVLDEPSTFLDIAHEMAQFEVLAALAASGRAVLLVSHQLNLVARFANTIVLLDAGTIVAHGTPSDVMRADVLERVYQWPLVVSRDPAVGAPALVPLRAPRTPSPLTPPKSQ